MFKTSLAKGAAMTAAGVLGLMALSWLGPVLAPDPASAETAANGQARGMVRFAAVESSTTSPARDRNDETSTTPRTGTQNDTKSLGSQNETIRQMLREHMGLTDEEADKWAGDMAEMMGAMHGDQADEMLEACAAQAGTTDGEDGASRGMMGGATGGSNGGMMGGGNGLGGMMGGGSGGMMGGGSGGMMGGGSGGMMGF